MKKSIFLLVAILSTFIATAQSKLVSNTAMPAPADLVNAALSTYLVPDSKEFSEGFMKKAVLVDASGKIIVGKKAIKQWRENLQTAQQAGVNREVIEKHINNLGPNLASMALKVRISSPGNQPVEATVHSLCNRIDGKWYYETCTIVPTVVVDSAVATAEN